MSSDSQIKFNELPETLKIVEGYKVGVRLNTLWNQPFVNCDVYKLIETGQQKQFWTPFMDGRIYSNGKSCWEYNSTDYVEFDSIESIDKVARLQKRLYQLAAELFEPHLFSAEPSATKGEKR